MNQKLERLLDIACKHGIDELSDGCEICIEIKELKSELEVRLEERDNAITTLKQRNEDKRKLESKNEKLQGVIDDTTELLDKILCMNKGDFDFYARVELRNKNDELKSQTMMETNQKEYHCDVCSLQSNVIEMLIQHGHETKHSFTSVMRYSSRPKKAQQKIGNVSEK